VNIRDFIQKVTKNVPKLLNGRIYATFSLLGMHNVSVIVTYKLSENITYIYLHLYIYTFTVIF